MKGNSAISFISRGWEEVSQDIADAVIATLLAGVSFILLYLVLMQLIPIIGKLLLPPILGIYATGYAYYFLKRVKGKPAEFRDVFAGFIQFWKSAIGASYFLSLISLQFLLFFSQHFLIVGIVSIASFLVGILYLYTFIAIADGEVNVWVALERSRALITPKYKDYFLLSLVLLGLNILGGLIIVGLFLTLPLTTCTLIRAYVSETQPATESTP